MILIDAYMNLYMHICIYAYTIPTPVPPEREGLPDPPPFDEFAIVLTVSISAIVPKLAGIAVCSARYPDYIRYL
jgi:hypothetical protein